MNYRKNIISNTFWMGLTEVIVHFLSFIFFIYLVRTLSSAVVGQYTYLMSITPIFFLLSDFGLTTWMYRKWTTDVSLLVEDYTVYLFSRSVLGLLACLFGVMVAFLTSKNLLLPFSIALVLQLLAVYFDFNNTYFMSRNHSQKRMIAIALERLISVMLGVVVLFLGYGLIALLLSFVLSRVISISVQFMLFPFRIKKIPLIMLLTKSRRLIIKSYPFFFASIFFNLYYRVDNVVLKFFVTFQQLAAYNVAFQIIIVINLVPVVFQHALFPALSKIYENINADFGALFNRSMKYISALSIGIVFGILILAPRIMSEIFTSQYSESASVLQILILSNLPIFINVQLINMLMIQKKENNVALVTLGILLLNILLDIILVNYFSIYGVAFGTFICEITMMLILYRIAKIPIYIYKSVLISLICGILMSSFLLLMIKLPLLLLIFMGACLYIMLQFLLKNFSLKEIVL